MSLRLSVRDLAEQDLDEAFDQYEAKLPGLGIDLHNEIAEVLNRIAENPRLYPHSEIARYRKAALLRFPFCIYYCVYDDLVVVIAIHDARSDPQRWKERT